MKLFFLTLVISVLWVVQAHAQPTPGQCAFTVYAEDAECTTGHDCVSPVGCRSVNFTVPCTGCYCLEIELRCGANGCKYCQACGNVYSGGNWVAGANCHNDVCDTGTQCSKACCESFGQFKLLANTQYTLYACLNACPSAGITCDDCHDSCTARATLILLSEEGCE